MKTTTKQTLKVMRILTWVIFLGLCINTGAILYSFFVSHSNPEGAKNLLNGLNLFDLKAFSTAHYSIMVLLLVVLSASKAYMFYQVITIFLKINFVSPFNTTVALVLKKISYAAIAIGILTFIAVWYNEWFIKQGVILFTLPEFIDGGAEFLFFAGIIFIVSLVFKRGIELQTENELTV